MAGKPRPQTVAGEFNGVNPWAITGVESIQGHSLSLNAPPFCSGAMRLWHRAY